MKSFLICVRISFLYIIAESWVRDVMNLLVVCLILITVRLMDVSHAKRLYAFESFYKHACK